jgi:hypothetical protein
MDISSIDRKFLAKQEKLLNSHLDEIRPEVASRVEKIIGTNFSLHSFHAQRLFVNKILRRKSKGLTRSQTLQH